MREPETTPRQEGCRHGEDNDSPSTYEGAPCGVYTPPGNHVTDVLCFVVGNLLTITVIGAVVGLPLMRWALARMKRRSRTGLNRFE